MKRHSKKITRTMLTMGLFSLALVVTPLPFDAGSIGLPSMALTARAEETTEGTATLDESTRILYLSGNVVKADVQAFADNENVKYIVAREGTVLPADCSKLFKDFKKVELMNLEHVDTSNVTNMGSMFYGCENLATLDVKAFNTSNVDYMNSMFSGCKRLQSIYNLNAFNTSKVTDMGYMFCGCEWLMSLNLDSFDTSKVYGMYYMFANCRTLKSLNLASFSAKRSPLTKGMFEGCEKLTSIYVSDLWNQTYSYDSTNMFKDCVKLVGGNGTKYNSSHTDREYARIDDDGKPGYFTFGTSNCSFNLVNGTLTLKGNGDASYGDASYRTAFVNHYSDLGIIKKVDALEGTVLPANCTDLFSGLTDVTEIDLHNADTSKVTNMFRMFEGCESCKNFDLRGWDTSKVTNMSSMFYECSALTNDAIGDNSELKGIQAWNTDSVTDLSYMFSGSGIKSLFLGSNRIQGDNMYEDAWKTDQVTKYNSMFSNCENLETLQIYNFTLKSGASVKDMFYGCAKLDRLRFFREFQITSAMKLDNTYGWTDEYSNGMKISGDGEYAVIPVHSNGLANCFNLRTLEAVDLTAVAYHQVAFVADRPYFGNVTDGGVTSYAGQGYTVDQEFSGWVDAERNCFMSKTDSFQPYKGYIFRVRLVPEGGKYFENPTAEVLSQLKIVDFADFEKEYLEVQAAHLNDNGTLDVYAILTTSASYNGNAFNIANKNDPDFYYLPEGTVYKASGFESAGGIYAYRMPKMYTGTDITTDSILLYKFGGFTANTSYQAYMGISGFETSLNGKTYENMVMYNGRAFEGLASGTDYTISVRVIGEAEPFWSETFRTEGSAPAVIAITKQPRDWYGTIGKKATFSVEATGEELAYQWQYKKSGNWIDYAITTADTATLKVTMNEKNMKWPIRCVITDKYGREETTREVWLKDSSVSAPITITKQPSDFTGVLGKKATFTVEASGNGLSYQWQYKKGSKWMPYTVATATTATLKAPINETTIQYPVRCKITDEDGFTATTNEVWMKLQEGPVTEGPQITKQPADWVGLIGKKAQFTVTATGNGLSYQWQYKKGTGAWTDYAIATADTANFSVTMSEKNVKWLYRCVITDADGKTATTNEVHMYVKGEEPAPVVEGPVITGQPGDYTGRIGKKATFSVTATGEGLTYEWQVKKTGGWSAYALAGYDTPTFQVSINDKTATWTYRCVIRDAAGHEVATNEVHIYVAD